MTASTSVRLPQDYRADPPPGNDFKNLRHVIDPHTFGGTRVFSESQSGTNRKGPVKTGPDLLLLCSPNWTRTSKPGSVDLCG